jgi:predicted CoA-binding protein
MGKTVVIGASENTDRYSNRAVRSLVQHNEPVVAVGLREGKIGDIEILTGFPKLEDVETVTLYVGPQNQSSWYDYILSLKPKRVIFNPGTENPELERLCADAGIETVEACTLVMLSVGTY